MRHQAYCPSKHKIQILTHSIFKQIKPMKESTTRLIAAALIIFMVVVALWSLTADTAIMDEVAHLPAGYSYVTQQDMRLNPEHPPLIKDLSGLAVLAFSKILEWPINFPSDIKAWTQALT